MVREVFKTWLEMPISRKEEADWDICWSDMPITDKFLKKMKPH